MNTALWQVGWGYFLSNMVGTEAGLTRSRPRVGTAALSRSRAQPSGRFRRFAAAPQPYGLLPVTSLDLWQPQASAGSTTAQDAWLKEMLVALRDIVWRPAAASVARIGNRQSPPDPDADLADVMRTDALSSVVPHAQRLRHPLPAAPAAASSGRPWPTAIPAQIALLSQLGVRWRPRLCAAVERGLASARDGAAGPGRAKYRRGAALEPELHLDAPRRTAHRVVDSPPGQIRVRRRTDEPAAALLRHALLREIANAAARLQADETGVDLTDAGSGTPNSSTSSPARRRRSTGNASSIRRSSPPAGRRFASTSRPRPASPRRRWQHSASCARAWPSSHGSTARRCRS